MPPFLNSEKWVIKTWFEFLVYYVVSMYIDLPITEYINVAHAFSCYHARQLSYVHKCIGLLSPVTANITLDIHVTADIHRFHRLYLSISCWKVTQNFVWKYICTRILKKVEFHGDVYTIPTKDMTSLQKLFFSDLHVIAFHEYLLIFVIEIW